MAALRLRMGANLGAARKLPCRASATTQCDSRRNPDRVGSPRSPAVDEPSA
jgi:hypothetical protein